MSDVGFAEVVAQRDLEGVVVVFASVLENEVSAGGVVGSVVDESMGAAALREIRLSGRSRREVSFPDRHSS